MKKCSRCLKVQSKARFSKNRAVPSGLQNVCKPCKRVYDKAWKLKNPEKVAEQMRRNYVKNAEEWKRYTREWAKANPAVVATHSKNRRLAALQRTPKWLTKSDWIEMNWAYDISKQQTKSTGVRYSVDHIIPLQGKNVSGFHCPQNLRVIPLTENIRKSNKADI